MAFRAPLERLRRRLVDLLHTEHGFTPDEAEAAVVMGAYLDDALVGLPAAAAARVPELAEETLAPAGCRVQPGKTKVWVPEGLCPRGYWALHRALKLLSLLWVNLGRRSAPLTGLATFSSKPSKATAPSPLGLWPPR